MNRDYDLVPVEGVGYVRMPKGELAKRHQASLDAIGLALFGAEGLFNPVTIDAESE